MFRGLANSELGLVSSWAPATSARAGLGNDAARNALVCRVLVVVLNVLLPGVFCEAESKKRQFTVLTSPAKGR